MQQKSEEQENFFHERDVNFSLFKMFFFVVSHTKFQPEFSSSHPSPKSSMAWMKLIEGQWSDKKDSLNFLVRL